MFKKYLYYRNLIKERNYKVLLKQIEINNPKPSRRFVKKLNLLYYQSSLLANWKSIELEKITILFAKSLRIFVISICFPIYKLLFSITIISIIGYLSICNFTQYKWSLCKHLCLKCKTSDGHNKIIYDTIVPCKEVPQSKNDSTRIKGKLKFATYITQITEKNEIKKVKLIENGQLTIYPLNKASEKREIKLINSVFDTSFLWEKAIKVDNFIFQLIPEGNYYIYPNQFQKSDSFDIKIIKKSKFFTTSLLDNVNEKKKEELLNNLLLDNLYYGANQLFNLFQQFDNLYNNGVKFNIEEYTSFLDKIYRISEKPEFGKIELYKKTEFFRTWWIVLIRTFVNTEINNSKVWISSLDKIRSTLLNNTDFQLNYTNFHSKLIIYYTDTFNISKIDNKFNPPPE